MSTNDPLTVLGDLMSDISEACYYAGWLDGTEYMVPELARRAASTGVPQSWGHGVVTPEQGRHLIALAEAAGSWAALNQDGDGYRPHDPWPLPPQFAEALLKEPPERG